MRWKKLYLNKLFINSYRSLKISLVKRIKHCSNLLNFRLHWQGWSKSWTTIAMITPTSTWRHTRRTFLFRRSCNWTTPPWIQDPPPIRIISTNPYWKSLRNFSLTLNFMWITFPQKWRRNAQESPQVPREDLLQSLKPKTSRLYRKRPRVKSGNE